MADRPSAGFTLLEVLVSFAIAALAVPPVLHLMSQGLGAGTAAEAQLRATIHARSLLASAWGEEMREGVAEGGTDDGFSWSRTVVASDVPMGRLAEYVVTVKVGWRRPATAGEVMLQTLRAAPPPERAGRRP